MEENLEEKIEQNIEQKEPVHLDEHKVIDLYEGVRGLAVKILNRV